VNIEQQGVRTAIETYFTGHASGDPAHMHDAFLPNARIEGFRERQFIAWTLEEYCSIFTGNPAVDEASRSRTIDFIEVSGCTAMVKATLHHGAMTFIDYFLMLKKDGRWKIANKVFQGFGS
jgi:Putative lumazine-binding